MSRKAFLLICLFLSSLVLAGWGKKEVSLLDTNKLIDLGKAIEIAKPGGITGNSSEGSEHNIDSSSIEQEVQETESETQKIEIETQETESETQETEPEIEEPNNESMISETMPQEKERYFEISIHGQVITLNGEESSIDAIKERLYREYSLEPVIVKLIDDFAWSETYKAVKKMLDELNSEIGLIYSEES